MAGIGEKPACGRPYSRMVRRLRGDKLGDFVPASSHEAAAPPRHPGGPLFRILDDGAPGGDGSHRRACLAPCLDESLADQGILNARSGVEIPAVAGAPGAAARFVVRQVGAGAGIVGLLGFPGDDPALYIDLPGAGAGAVHPVGRADDLVACPALPIGVFPFPALVRGNPCPSAKESRLRRK